MSYGAISDGSSASEDETDDVRYLRGDRSARSCCCVSSFILGCSQSGRVCLGWEFTAVQLAPISDGDSFRVPDGQLVGAVPSVLLRKCTYYLVIVHDTCESKILVIGKKFFFLTVNNFFVNLKHVWLPKGD